MEKVLITTTSTLAEGYNIEEYYGFISVEIVTATSIFTDFIAGFRDIVGGVSNIYSEEVENLREMVLEELTTKTRSLGMNCVLGTKIDIEPIFGQGVSMFLLSASGTAAKVRKNYEKPLTEEEIRLEAISRDLNNIKVIRNIAKLPEDLSKATLKELYMITYNKDMGVALELIKVLTSLKNEVMFSTGNKKIKILKDYFEAFPYDEISKALCSSINENNYGIIRYFKLLDYNMILERIRGTKDKEELWLYINVLFATPKTITKNSFNGLKALIDYFEGTFNNEVQIKLVGAFAKKEKWICKECGSECDLKDRTCHFCAHDRYGLHGKFSYDKLLEHLKTLVSIGRKYF